MDSPEEIKDKIFITSNINLSSEQRNFELLFKPPAKLYKFTVNSLIYIYLNPEVFLIIQGII